jgi:hypothetical protein
VIKYRLGCASGHEFDSWFRSSEDYDRQSLSGAVACPLCGSADIAKQPMAPAVVTGRGKEARSREMIAMRGEPPRAVLDALRSLKQSVIDNTQDVGSRFADEARKMHFGEIEERHIRGSSTPDEARSLIDEGVPFGILPPLPEDHN